MFDVAFTGAAVRRQPCIDRARAHSPSADRRHVWMHPHSGAMRSTHWMRHERVSSTVQRGYWVSVPSLSHTPWLLESVRNAQPLRVRRVCSGLDWV